AAELADQALTPDGDDGDERVEREVLRAEIALAMAEPAVAEVHARRALAGIDAQAARLAPPAALRSWLVTDHRRPYELIFASLALRGDAAGALAVLDQVRGLDARASRLVDDHGRSRIAADGGVAIAEVAGELAASTPRPVPPTRAAQIWTIAAAALWKITVDARGATIERVGAIRELAAQLSALGLDAPLRPIIRPIT
ncbi:MAG TPA: hypothetical protein VGC42_24700, partial [Kofleriaceae bacterium]